MGDRLAYFKGLRLGDYLSGPESRTPEINPPNIARASWANHGTIDASNAGAVHRIALQANLQMGESEDARDFDLRKLAFTNDVVRVAGAVGYAILGDLCIVWDSGTDVTALAFDYNAPDGLIFTEDIACEAGDFLLLIDADTPANFEIITVTTYDPGTKTATATVTGTYHDGSVVARLLYYLPGAFMTRAPSIPGQQPENYSSALNLEFEFTSVEDPVFPGST